jgi:hypothetical protein
MAKVVIDANVIISAAFGGNPLRAVIRAMQEDEVYQRVQVFPGFLNYFNPTRPSKNCNELYICVSP